RSSYELTIHALPQANYPPNRDVGWNKLGRHNSEQAFNYQYTRGSIEGQLCGRPSFPQQPAKSANNGSREVMPCLNYSCSIGIQMLHEASRMVRSTSPASSRSHTAWVLVLLPNT